MAAKTERAILVVGAGVMGNAIAQVMAVAGMEVGMVDLDQKALDRAMALAASSLETLADFGLIPKDEIPSVLSRITPSTDLPAVARDAGFVFEVVPEVPDIKKAVYAELEAACPGDAVIASNTSGLDVFKIADAKRPERLVITHFFAPAHIIPLVEVVPGPETRPEVLTATVDLLERAGKSPVVLKEFVPSFIVNRIQNAIGTAVEEILDNGWATPDDIDRAVKMSIGIRMPVVGVVQTLDFAGLDLVKHIATSLGKKRTPFDELVEQGHFGVKTSKGIYDYGGRSEAEILQKRDALYLKMLAHLKKLDAFRPV